MAEAETKKKKKVHQAKHALFDDNSSSSSESENSEESDEVMPAMPASKSVNLPMIDCVQRTPPSRCSTQACRT